MMEKTDGKLVVVLGMHRSGTSAITRGLQVLGVDLGDRFIPVEEDVNRKGFWEDSDLNALNIDIIGGALHSDWHYLTPFDAQDFEILRQQGYLLRGQELLRHKVEHVPIFGFKDPRVAQILPFWKEVIAACHFDVKYVIAVRHPLSVVQSLAKRNGFAAEKSYLLWLGHVMASVTGTIGERRVLVDFDRLMLRPDYELARIGKCFDLPVDPAGLQSYMTEYLDPGLRHTVYDLAALQRDEACPPLVQEIFVALSQVAADEISLDDPAFQKNVESWRREFDRLRVPMALVDGHAREAVERNAAIARMTHTLSLRDEQVASLNKAVAVRDGRIVIHEQVEGDLRGEISLLQHFKDEVLNSTSWRITLPLREVVRSLRQRKPGDGSASLLVKAVSGLKDGGRALLTSLRSHPGNGRDSEAASGPEPGPVKKTVPFSLPETISWQASEILASRILLIVEMNISQCTKYRVRQKQVMLVALGCDCTVLSWTETEACLSTLSTHSQVIFYRVPATPQVERMFAEARRLRVQTFWEIDDLMFDRDILAGNKNLTVLDPETVKGVLDGAAFLRTAMLSCDVGIASTEGLAAAMRQAGMSEVVVIENALDLQTLNQAEKVRCHRAKPDDPCLRIVYGSGTNTHDIDFLEAAGAILQILDRFPDVRFRVIGTLELPELFAQFHSQIERIPFCAFDQYLQCLAECDISIAPLADYVSNDAKSNIKFLEASILRIPTVCSPRSAFSQAVMHGVNGFLCATQEEWLSALTLLVSDGATRERVGLAASDFVAVRYSPENIGKQQVMPLVRRRKEAVDDRRVLTVNIFYSPRSFGGATIVAEELNRIINRSEEFHVSVFTTLPEELVPAYELRRYEVDGVSVFGVGHSFPDDARMHFENPHILEAFENTLNAVQPGLVHFHSIQGIGVAVADMCAAKGIPYIVTLHDAWWLCGRQFMVTREGKFCSQEIIDPRQCATCVDDVDLNRYRQARLGTVLRQASLLLTPSRYFADFYIKNGFPPDKVLVNKNGVRQPVDPRKYRGNGPLSFGYVGGNGEAKGVHLVKQVFTDLTGVAVRLVVVDNTLNLGSSSYEDDFFLGVGDVEIIPAYTQETIDGFFSSIDVLLFPTQCKESFGLVLREALARNVWVITTDAGGVVEDIIPGKNGFIVPFDDNGVALKQAVLDTMHYYQQFNVGDEICLETTQISWFADQALELGGIYKRIMDGNV